LGDSPERQSVEGLPLRRAEYASGGAEIMSPAQSKMILRKLEKLEAAYIEQAKRLKLAESDLQVMTMRTRALSAEVDRLRGVGTRLERTEDMVDQVIRAGGRRG